MQKEITKELLWTLLDYDSATGDLTWKERSLELFNHLPENLAKATCATFNTSYAGTPALNSLAACGYKVGAIFSVKYYAHRVIWFMFNGEWPKVIDHENGNPSDNRWVNLRNVSLQENSKNISKPKTNTTGHVNIRSKKGRSTFEVQIKINNRSKQVGTFKTIDEAIKARDMAWIEAGFHKNHCSLNRSSKS